MKYVEITPEIIEWCLNQLDDELLGTLPKEESQEYRIKLRNLVNKKYGDLESKKKIEGLKEGACEFFANFPRSDLFLLYKHYQEFCNQKDDSASPTLPDTLDTKQEKTKKQVISISIPGVYKCHLKDQIPSVRGTKGDGEREEEGVTILSLGPPTPQQGKDDDELEKKGTNEEGSPNSKDDNVSGLVCIEVTKHEPKLGPGNAKENYRYGMNYYNAVTFFNTTQNLDKSLRGMPEWKYIQSNKKMKIAQEDTPPCFVNRFPNTGSEAPERLLIFPPGVGGGPSVDRRSRNALMTNIDFKRDGMTCKKHLDGCGKDLVKSGLLVYLDGTDIHRVKGVYYIGCREYIYISRSLGCKVGVVKVLLSQVDLFVNRIGVVGGDFNIGDDRITGSKGKTKDLGAGRCAALYFVDVDNPLPKVPDPAGFDVEKIEFALPEEVIADTKRYYKQRNLRALRRKK